MIPVPATDQAVELKVNTLVQKLLESDLKSRQGAKKDLLSIGGPALAILKPLATRSIDSTRAELQETISQIETTIREEFKQSETSR
jgi:hypothetical protein